MKYHHTHIQIAEIKRLITPYVDKDVKQLELYIAHKSVRWYKHFGSLVVPLKLYINLTTWPRNSTWRCLPNRIENLCIHRLVLECS